MRRFLMIGIVFGLLLAPVALAQIMLPSSLPGWNSTNGTAVTSADLNQIAGDSTPALLEYGAFGAEQRSYAAAGNAQHTIVATIYSFQDASGAYGAYSFLRTPEMRRADYSEVSAKSVNTALALVGSKLLVVSGNGITNNEALIKRLVASLGSPKQEAVYPSLPMRLPKTDLIPRTDHYFLGPVALAQFWPETSTKGDWLGFSFGAEAETAKYRISGGQATLLVIDYPTPQIAATQLARMAKQFSINTAGGTGGGAGAAVYARRDGSLVALLAGAPSEETANSVLDKIESGVVLTWNEPVLKHAQPSMATIVVGTIVGTGEICLFTVFGGVLYTIIRLGIKKWLPGKVFDRPDQFEILQMGLSSKPIKAKDFY